jgi:hypothetical protein
MRPSVATFLAGLRDTGVRVFENITALGGTLEGIPVITSSNVPTSADSPNDHMIILLDAAEILLADAGITFDVSEQATVQMSTTPDSPANASTELVSLWQHDLLGILCTRYVHWARRRDGCCAYVSGFSIS